MPILIDGHNLIGRLASLSLADADDEESLIRLLQAWRARTGKAVTVFFDPGAGSGLAERRKVGGIQVVFARPGTTADALIRNRVASNRNPGGLTVVTSDRELAQAVSRLGARTRPAEDLARELESSPGAAPRREQPPTPEEVEQWLTLFGDRDE